MPKRWRLTSSSPRISTEGRWMMSIADNLSPAGQTAGTSLLGVELDDQLFADRHVDVLAHRQVADGHLEALGAGVQPRRHLAIEGVHVVTDDDQVPRLGLEGDDVTPA